MFQKVFSLTRYSIPQIQIVGVMQRRVTIKQETSNFIYTESNNADWTEDDTEADFTNLNDVYNKHINEKKNEKKKINFLIQQKYFHKKMPNFLYWNEKKQIYYLYNTDPEEWNTERLSESFPALPCVIKKIIKTQWAPESSERINHHDENVSENWKLFRNNEIEVDKRMKDHLNKFSVRQPRTIKFETNNNSLNICGYSEFRNLIKSKEQNSTQTENYMFKQISDQLSSTNKGINKSNMTLNQFKEHNKLAVSNLEQICKTETEVLNKSMKTSSNQVVSHHNKTISYLENINIPKNKWKKGYTYKINNCYYDDDGTFLYKVVGA